MVKLAQGYAYVLTGAPASRWRSCHEDSYEIDMTDQLTGETLGTRTIDGAKCVVVLCPDGIVRAQQDSHVTEK